MEFNVEVLGLERGAKVRRVKMTGFYLDFRKINVFWVVTSSGEF